MPNKSKIRTKAKAKPSAKNKNAEKNARVHDRVGANANANQGTAYRLRRSSVHGSGLFATRSIAKGEVIVEYKGERITHDEADRRHANKADDDAHTFLFTIDAKTVVDGGVGGNEARFINHSCAPNCEVINEDGRLLIEAIRIITLGEELAYDYSLTRDPDDDPEVDTIFACRCKAPTCRGTMLAPRKKPKVDLPSPVKPLKQPKNVKRVKRASRGAQP